MVNTAPKFAYLPALKFGLLQLQLCVAARPRWISQFGPCDTPRNYVVRISQPLQVPSQTGLEVLASHCLRAHVLVVYAICIA